MLWRLAREGEALANLEEAIPLFVAVVRRYPSVRQMTADFVSKLAVGERQKGRLQGALVAARGAAELQRLAVPDGFAKAPSAFIDALTNYAELLDLTDQASEAQAVRAQITRADQPAPPNSIEPDGEHW